MQLGRAIVLGIALAGSGASGVFVAAAPAADARIEEMESAIARRVDTIRRDHGMQPLRVDPTLANLAREYSCALATRGGLSHSDPVSGTVVDRLRAAGKTFAVVGENLASNTNAPDPVAAAVDGWMQSPSHRDNILDRHFTETGVGGCRRGATHYFTQVFVRPGNGT